ncbi:MAG: regulatory protein [Actinomycetota bacterium]|nr:regulatory protein [Actinomycetota bacterium]
MPLSFSRDGVAEPAVEGGLERLPGLEVVPDAPEDDPYRKAMEKAGRLLSRRPQSRLEIQQKLRTGGFEPDVIERVIARLESLKLLDDAAFAGQWVQERGARKGPRALRAELARKGVSREIGDEAVASSGIDEQEVALKLASRWVGRVSGRPLRDQAARVFRMLVGRGFSYEVAEEATKAVLPPEGWD